MTVVQVELFYTEDIQVFKKPDDTAQQPPDGVAAGATAITEGPARSILNSSLLALSGAQMKKVPIFGRGGARPGGIQKERTCTICNLHPVSGISRAEKRRASAALLFLDDDDDSD